MAYGPWMISYNLTLEVPCTPIIRYSGFAVIVISAQGFGKYMTIRYLDL